MQDLMTLLPSLMALAIAIYIYRLADNLKKTAQKYCKEYYFLKFFS